MGLPKVTLARAFRLPPGWDVFQERTGDWFLERRIDGRQALIEWEDGEKTYTSAFLSGQVYSDGDDAKPELKGFL